MQQIIQTGYLGRDVKMRYTPEGTAVADFSLGVTVGWGDRKHTQWWKVTSWKNLAETVNTYLSKGSWVMVIGTVNDEDGNPRMWDGNDGSKRSSFEMTANSIEFGPKVDNQQRQPGPAPAAAAGYDQGDEIPF
jgi:single-strand DNA-binding protein